MERISGLPKVCPHFHLSLQSGCDTVLKRMNRRYTVSDIQTITERIRRFYDRPALTADIIVGFPGETEQDFMGVPVIFLTGRNDRNTIMDVMGLKPEGYLLKSMSSDAFVQAIDEFFEKK